MSNRLANETSPYLLQHADNPVDWWPWCDEAFEAARRRDVPVFLSVGYSSCHWCHVMAHESFEDEQVAEVLNDHFVSIKVDREERPDVDAVYMDAVQALSGRGGWPMSVFLTPDGEPFFGGTYWPRDDRRGMPGFLRVLASVREAWNDRREEVTDSAQRLTEAIRERTDALLGQDAAGDGAGPGGGADLTVTDRAASAALQAWDRELGGFGQAPKFPQAMTLEWLLDRAAAQPDQRADEQSDELACVVASLDAMARGGIHDQVGGGFHRYSTDNRWLVPHFEKMLYDNTLLAPVYAKAAALTGRSDFDRVARDTLDYLLREMRDETGGFYSATDADSEGEEGRFFVWSRAELVDIVNQTGADGALFADFFGATEAGNWEDTNILHEPSARRDFCERRDLDLAVFAKELERVKAALYAHREDRVHPGLDDKVLTSWNALAVRALAVSGMHLGLPEYVDAAVETAQFLRDELVVDGRLHHVYKDGQVHVPAFLEDVAYLAVACLDLYAVTGDTQWFTAARDWADEARRNFRDDDNGGFYSTAEDADELFTRPKDTWDNATPAGNSCMAEVAARLSAYTGESSWRHLADELAAAFQSGAERAPTGFGWYLRVLEGLRVGPREVAIVGHRGRERELLVRELWRRPLTGTVIAVAEPDDRAGEVVPLLAGRGEVDGSPAAYVCRDFVCEQPVTRADELRGMLAPDE